MLFCFRCKIYSSIVKIRASIPIKNNIEGRPAELTAENLQDAFNEYC